jgi:hypothetical protein
MAKMLECDGCYQEFAAGQLHFAYDRSGEYCDDCVDQCGDCSEWFYWGVDDHMFYCCMCDRSFCPDYRSYDRCDSCGDIYCENCDPCCMTPNMEIGGIHAWSSPRYQPPNFQFHGTGVHMGIELEVGGEPREIQTIVNEFDGNEEFVYMCEDGSVDGVEIITLPMTLEFIRSGFPFRDMLAELNQAGCTADGGFDGRDGIGIHIHVGREQFRNDKGRHNAAHVYRWIKFLYSVRTETETHIARRSSERWAKYAKLDRGELARKSRRYATGDNRYVAVNTTNAATYEVRVFKSTLDYREFMRNVEFVAASVEYARTGMRDIPLTQAMTWAGFADFIRDNAGTYPQLAAYFVFVTGDISVDNNNNNGK